MARVGMPDAVAMRCTASIRRPAGSLLEGGVTESPSRPATSRIAASTGTSSATSANRMRASVSRTAAAKARAAVETARASPSTRAASDARSSVSRRSIRQSAVYRKRAANVTRLYHSVPLVSSSLLDSARTNASSSATSQSRSVTQAIAPGTSGLSTPSPSRTLPS
jgi:hypothetical protein